MKQALILAFVLMMVAGCDDPPAAPEAASADSDASAASQQQELDQQKLTIEQAAEEATKLIEADAKAEIDAATPVAAEPAQ